MSVVLVKLLSTVKVTSHMRACMTQAFHQPRLVVQRVACQERIPAHACSAMTDSASSFMSSNRAPASRPSLGPGANGQLQVNQESQKE